MYKLKKKYILKEIFYWGNYMFTTFMVPLFIFTTTKEIFSKIPSSLSGKIHLCHCYYLYI